MIKNGADCLVIASVDSEALINVLNKAKRKGIYVIAYDRLLMGTDALSYYATYILNVNGIRAVLNKGFMEKSRCCITCGKCSELMREGAVSGCPVKDSDVYMPIYKDKVMRNA